MEFLIFQLKVFEKSYIQEWIAFVIRGKLAKIFSFYNTVNITGGKKTTTLDF